LLGGIFRRGSGLTILDCAHGAARRGFLRYGEGEEYEVDLGDRKLVGLVLQRNLVRFEEGELSWLACRAGPSHARGVGGGRGGASAAAGCFHGRMASARGPRRRSTSSWIQPNGLLVELPPRETALILGEAGCGKTTVAFASAARAAARGNERFRAACIVPKRGPAPLDRVAAPPARTRDVETWTWDKFASKQARRVFPDLRRRESEDTPSGVSRSSATRPCGPRWRRSPAGRRLLPKTRRRGGRGSPGGRTCTRSSATGG